MRKVSGTLTHFFKFEEHRAGKVIKVSHKMVMKTLLTVTMLLLQVKIMFKGRFFNLQRLILCFLCFLGLVGDKGNKEST